MAFLMGSWTATVIAVSDTGGAGPHPIAGGSGTTAWNAAWSPDGTQIAFQSDRTGRMEVWVMNDDGTGARQVTGRTP